MTFSTSEESLIFQLSNMIDELLLALDQLGENTRQGYKSIHKVKNILNSRDAKGMKNVKRHLMMDFRMIEDRQLESDALDNLLETIYYHVSNNGIFNP